MTNNDTPSWGDWERNETPGEPEGWYREMSDGSAAIYLDRKEKEEGPGWRVHLVVGAPGGADADDEHHYYWPEQDFSADDVKVLCMGFAAGAMRDDGTR